MHDEQKRNVSNMEEKPCCGRLLPTYLCFIETWTVRSLQQLCYPCPGSQSELHTAVSTEIEE